MPPTDATSSGADRGQPERALAILRSTTTIRERASGLLERARAGQSANWRVHDFAMPQVARVVAEVTQSRYPDLKIPFHSRWRHFEAGGLDRKPVLEAALGTTSVAGRSARDRLKCQIDLAVVSVLLDAGSGPDWGYQDAASGQRLTRSEGLGVASFNAFLQGMFSSDPAQPLRADAAGLERVTAEGIAQAFQVGTGNPLVGVEGRAALLQRLGAALRVQGWQRPGDLADALLAPSPGMPGVPARPQDAPESVAARGLLQTVLATFSSIWPAQNQLQDDDGRLHPLGDCWRHPGVGGEGLTRGWMPFHKLSQWLSYSLLEPFLWAGVEVTGLDGLDGLTGLPEYRNGGLLIDGGVLAPVDAGALTRPHRAGDAFIVEWRALTVALLDELAPLVRQALHVSAAQMPLACVLEGGTWAAGRVLAARLRGGAPPLNIASDGTVF